MKWIILSVIILFIACKKDSSDRFGYHVICTDCDVTYSIKGIEYSSHAAGSLDYYFSAKVGDYLSLEAKDRMTTSWVELKITRDDEDYSSKKEKGTARIGVIIY